MYSVKCQYSSTLEIKKSTFISYIIPISSFDIFRTELKELHPKARHIVWAKRSLNKHNQVVENCSDDGEPKGTSGPPILNVMRGNELIECAILVVRYFGGIKLGTGGLVRAYGRSAKDVIAVADIEEYIKKEQFIFSTAYPLVPRFEHFLDKQALHVEDRSYEAASIVWKLNLSKQEQDLFLEFARCFERDGFKVL